MEEPGKEFEKLDGIEPLEEVEIETEKPLWRRVLWRVVAGITALVVIVGLLYISGLRQYFFYRKTPQNVEARKMESILGAETMSVPVYARILRVENSSDSSTRDQDNIKRLVTQANRIWAQADIELKLVGVGELRLSEDEFDTFSSSPRAFSKNLENFDSTEVNAYFIGNLEGPSGLAYTHSENILIADYTTSHDFLVFAHEIGHVLGLGHAGAEGTLMASGELRADITRAQAEKARTQANKFIK